MKQERHIVLNLIMILVCAAIIYPFLIIIGASFQTQQDIMHNGYSMIPKEATLDTYKAIFANPSSLVNAYKVTIMTTVIGTIIGVYLAGTCGYVISRKTYRYKRILSLYIFFGMLFSGGMVASYIWTTNGLHLKNSFWVLILPYTASVWNILLMKGYMSSIPDEMIESAKVDGAKEIMIFTKIVVPVPKPAIATLSLLYALQYWNDWMLPMLYIDDAHLVNLQYMLQKILKNMEYLNSADAIQYGGATVGQNIPTLGMRMAMCLLAAGPMMFVFPFFQKYFVKGLTIGSVKG